MNKQLLVLCVALFCYCFLMVGITSAQTQSTGRYVLDTGEFACYVYAPKEAKTDETFSVSFEIKPHVTIDVVSFKVEVYGNIAEDGDSTTWDYEWTNTKMFSDSDYKAEESFTVNSDSWGLGRVGEVWGIILATYDYNGQRYVVYSDFDITQIRLRTYSELAQDYNSLNQTYQELQNDYNSLNTSSNANIYQYSVVVFAITTLVFVTTTVYFMRRKKPNSLTERINQNS
jgi:hypothetical protein